MIENKFDIFFINNLSILRVFVLNSIAKKICRTSFLKPSVFAQKMLFFMTLCQILIQIVFFLNIIKALPKTDDIQRK